VCPHTTIKATIVALQELSENVVALQIDDLSKSCGSSSSTVVVALQVEELWLFKRGLQEQSSKKKGKNALEKK
jgi:hypothetical protein